MNIPDQDWYAGLIEMPFCMSYVTCIHFAHTYMNEIVLRAYALLIPNIRQKRPGIGAHFEKRFITCFPSFFFLLF